MLFRIWKYQGIEGLDSTSFGHKSTVCLVHRQTSFFFCPAARKMQLSWFQATFFSSTKTSLSSFVVINEFRCFSAPHYTRSQRAKRTVKKFTCVARILGPILFAFSSSKIYNIYYSVGDWRLMSGVHFIANNRNVYVHIQKTFYKTNARIVNSRKSM